MSNRQLPDNTNPDVDHDGADSALKPLDLGDGLPPILPECREAWEKVKARVKDGSRTKLGLRFVLSGMSVRGSSIEAGLAPDATTLREAIVRLDIRDAVASTNRAMKMHRQIRAEAQDRLLTQLEQGNLDDKPHALGVVMGIADDKIHRHETHQQDNTSALNMLQKVGEQLAKSGSEISIRIGPTANTESQPEPIDVTPEDAA